MQQISASSLSFLLKIAVGVGGCYFVWNKTPADLDQNTGLSPKSNSNNDSEIDLNNKIGIIVLRDNILCILDISSPG